MKQVLIDIDAQIEVLQEKINENCENEFEQFENHILEPFDEETVKEILSSNIRLFNELLVHIRQLRKEIENVCNEAEVMYGDFHSWDAMKKFYTQVPMIKGWKKSYEYEDANSQIRKDYFKAQIEKWISDHSHFHHRMKKEFPDLFYFMFKVAFPDREIKNDTPLQNVL